MWVFYCWDGGYRVILNMEKDVFFRVASGCLYILFEVFEVQEFLVVFGIFGCFEGIEFELDFVIGWQG